MVTTASSGAAKVSLLLETVAFHQPQGRGGVSMSEIARSLGKDKSSVSRQLRDAVAAGLLERDATGRFSLGWKIFALGSRAGDQHLARAAQPVLRRLSGLVSERSHVTVLANGQVLGLGLVNSLAGEGRWRNSYALLAGGEVLALQDKVHLVSGEPWREDLLFRQGTDTGVVTLPVAGAPRVAVVICNDMWHPIVPWAAVHQGAEVIVAPVASVAGDFAGVQQVWEVILSHTARMLGCFVVMVNHAESEEPGSSAPFWGGSRVYDPTGAELVRLGRQAQSCVVELDVEQVRQVRGEYPLLAELNVPYLRRVASRLERRVTERVHHVLRSRALGTRHLGASAQRRGARALLPRRGIQWVRAERTSRVHRRPGPRGS